MARADRRRAKRTRPAPGIRSSGGASAVEQTLFFSRLRRQAKWAFVFLAVVFAVGFVAFGVGSDVPGGVADILQGQAPGTGPSVEEAQENVQKNPRDANARLELVRALQNEGRADEAIPQLQRYTRLRPTDQDALRELATAYLGRAGRIQGEAQEIQLRAIDLVPGSDFLLPQTTELGQALGNRAITNAVQQSVQAELSELLGRASTAYRAAQRVYQRLVVLDPQDAPLQLSLADAARSAGDTATAVAAFRRFLELAPDDPQAPLVKQQIEQLEGAAPLVPSG